MQSRLLKREYKQLVNIYCWIIPKNGLTCDLYFSWFRPHPRKDKPRSKCVCFLPNLYIIHTKTSFWGSVNDRFWNQVPEWKDFEMLYTQLRDYWLSASFQICLQHSVISSLTRMHHTRQRQWRLTWSICADEASDPTIPVAAKSPSSQSPPSWTNNYRGHITALYDHFITIYVYNFCHKCTCPLFFHLFPLVISLQRP